MTKPHKAEAAEVADRAVEVTYSTMLSGTHFPTMGQLKQFAIKEFLQTVDKSCEAFNNQESITALKVQTAGLTSALSEVSSKDDDKKLRIRIIDSLLKTPLLTTGDSSAIRASKEKREGELGVWVKDLIKTESGFRPNFTVFIIEPKSAKQKPTGVLTLALESDKYRMERLIKKDRGDNPTKPSSQRYTGPEHPIFNVPNYKSVGDTIMTLYYKKMKLNLEKLSEEENKRLTDKWSHEPGHTLFISRKTSKNPFRVFFEFVDPSNNVTFMRYVPDMDPFTEFNFK